MHSQKPRSERLEIGGASTLESKLVVGNQTSSKPIFSTSRSSVLDKARSFLPKLAAANQTLQSELQNQGADAFDIEVVADDGPVIEMDLACGLLELQNEGAVAAAERVVEGLQQLAREGEAPGDSSDDSGSDSAESDDDGLGGAEERGAAATTDEGRGQQPSTGSVPSMQPSTSSVPSMQTECAEGRSGAADSLGPHRAGSDAAEVRVDGGQARDCAVQGGSKGGSAGKRRKRQLIQEL